MRYGNSNGGNKGKKYYIRGKEQEMEKIGEEVANQFRDWMGVHYAEVVGDLEKKSVYDEDIFNETYLRMYETFLYTASVVKSFKGYFMRAYFTNKTQIAIRESRYVCAELKEMKYLQVTTGVDDLEQKREKLENDIFDYVYAHYDVREFELFKMYVHLKPAINYNSLADITKVPAHKIHRIVSRIKQDLAANADFSRRRKEVI